jgi:hypothetical protein
MSSRFLSSMVSSPAQTQACGVAQARTGSNVVPTQVVRKTGRGHNTVALVRLDIHHIERRADPRVNDEPVVGSDRAFQEDRRSRSGLRIDPKAAAVDPVPPWLTGWDSRVEASPRERSKERHASFHAQPVWSCGRRWCEIAEPV